MQKHDAGVAGCFIGPRFAQIGKKIPTFTGLIRLLRDQLGYEQRKGMEAPLGGAHASVRRGEGPICRPDIEEGGERGAGRAASWAARGGKQERGTGPRETLGQFCSCCAG